MIRTLQEIFRLFFVRWRSSSALAGIFHIFGRAPSLSSSVRQAMSPSPKKIFVEMPPLFTPVMQFVKLSDNAFTPTKGSSGAAGYDLCSAYDYTIESMSNALVKTDIQIAVPEGCYGRIAPRSGLALKHFIDVGAGVVDEDYRGNVGIVLFNFGKECFPVRKGDRVAQLILERIANPQLQEVEKLEVTIRGSSGFGSTGVKDG